MPLPKSNNYKMPLKNVHFKEYSSHVPKVTASLIFCWDISLYFPKAHEGGSIVSDVHNLTFAAPPPPPRLLQIKFDMYLSLLTVLSIEVTMTVSLILIWYLFIYLFAIFKQACPVQHGWFKWRPVKNSTYYTNKLEMCKTTNNSAIR